MGDLVSATLLPPGEGMPWLDDVAPGPATTPSTTAPPRRDLWSRVWRGAETDPMWARPALFALLGLTAVLYLWGLGASGWANSYYSAAVQAGSHSWKAFFFGSLDAANSITVDKAPAFLWPMDLAARIFGVNAWSILVPQAIEGVAAVGVLYAAVRRWSTPAAGLIAGAVMALTPVAALMFRFNNPDALLVLLLTLAAYALVRALEHGSTRWVVAVGALVGFAFLAKMLQAFLVVPGFALVYLIAGPPKLGKRAVQTLLAGLAMLVAAGWWVALVMLVPASSRPYIGGSQNNSLFNLIFGYNGFGRLNGSESGSVGGGGNGTGRWGPTGWTRLFNTEFGGQASWLLPAALILFVGLLAVTWNRPRTDRTRAAALLWGGWLLVTGAAFSLGQGIIHPYYTVALAPPMGGLIGLGAVTLWQHRNNIAARCTLAVALVATAIWSYVLLDRAPSWNPSLRTLLILGGFTAAALLVALPALRVRAAVAVGVAAVAIGLLGPGSYSVATAATAHDGAIPSAGPTIAIGGRFGPGGAGGPGGFARRFGNQGANPGGNAQQFPNFGNLGNGQQFPNFGNGQQVPNFGGGNGGQLPNFGGGGAAGGGARGGIGGLLNGSTPSSELTAALEQNADDYTWVAATVGANNAAGYQLATNDPVMAIGGFNGTDPSPTLAQFQEWVREGKVHYFIGGGGFGGRGGGFGFGGGGSSTSSAIASWVANNYESTTVGGVTLYDLTPSTTGNI
jgi:4-amino-4-deoxy-L-arabinose transferase-like glycosyltransferase